MPYLFPNGGGEEYIISTKQLVFTTKTKRAACLFRSIVCSVKSVQNEKQIDPQLIFRGVPVCVWGFMKGAFDA